MQKAPLRRRPPSSHLNQKINQSTNTFILFNSINSLKKMIHKNVKLAKWGSLICDRAADSLERIESAAHRISMRKVFLVTILTLSIGFGAVLLSDVTTDRHLLPRRVSRAPNPGTNGGGMAPINTGVVGKLMKALDSQKQQNSELLARLKEAEAAAISWHNQYINQKRVNQQISNRLHEERVPGDEFQNGEPVIDRKEFDRCAERVLQLLPENNKLRDQLNSLGKENSRLRRNLQDALAERDAQLMEANMIIDHYARRYQLTREEFNGLYSELHSKVMGMPNRFNSAGSQLERLKRLMNTINPKQIEAKSEMRKEKPKLMQQPQPEPPTREQWRERRVRDLPTFMRAMGNRLGHVSKKVGWKVKAAVERGADAVLNVVEDIIDIVD